MNKKISVIDFMVPLESLEQTLEMLEDFYLDEQFEETGDAFELIENYKRPISILKSIPQGEII